MNQVNIEHEIKTLALITAIARAESDLDYQLAKTALVSLALSASLMLWEWSTPSVVAATLAVCGFTACVRLMVSLNLLKRAYADIISRV